MVTKAQARAAEEDAARQLTLEEELNELDGKIERLRILYEQFFIGVEKMEPIVLRKDVERTVRKLTQVNINNTGLRFRFQNQQQRMQVFAVHWGRVLRQIEAGTWKRTRGRDAILEENMPPAMRAARRRRERRLATIDARRMERGELPAGVHGEDVDVDDLELPPLPVIGADDWPDTPVSSGTPSSATPAVPRPHSTLVDDVRPTRRVIAAPGAIVSTKPPAAPPPPPSPVRVPLPRSAATTAAPLAPPMAPALPKAAATTAAPPAPPVAPALPKAAAPSAPPAAVIKPPALPPPPPAAALLARKPTVPPPSPSPAPSPSPPPSPPPSAATATAGATASVTAVRRPYERVFREFVEARKQAGQAGDVSYDNLEKTLKAQEEALRAQKKWSDVRFRVAIENGKAVVKAGRGDDKP